MNECRWDTEAEVYVRDGEPCRVDNHGDPTKHCTNRRSCGQHIGQDDLTCPRCVGRTRADIAAIPGLHALTEPLSLGGRVDSEAVNLNGPAADPESWSWRKLAARRGGPWHVSLEEDDDERHPYSVLTRWEFMLREDYGQERRDATSVTDAADYLGRVLHRVAQDPEQDFRDLSREIRKVRRHLEAVLHNSHAAERGQRCPACEEAGEPAPRLVRLWGHWCTDEDCTEQFHYTDTAGDRWICPRNREHWWMHHDYERWVEERKAG